ncbi:hypothetical protein B5C09_03645 [Staphylococcus delphini]|nr:hypothetical protein B5C09_03645 [Staphylococcus delphini]
MIFLYCAQNPIRLPSHVGINQTKLRLGKAWKRESIQVNLGTTKIIKELKKLNVLRSFPVTNIENQLMEM